MVLHKMLAKPIVEPGIGPGRPSAPLPPPERKPEPERKQEVGVGK